MRHDFNACRALASECLVMAAFYRVLLLGLEDALAKLLSSPRDEPVNAIDVLRIGPHSNFVV